MRYLTTLFITLISAFAGLSQTKTVNVKAFGAVADGHTLCTKAIQTAIDMMAKRGGGKVIIPNGYYLTGQLNLRSGVNLYLDNKATLLGSTNWFDYDSRAKMALILADKQKDIAITGNGVIDAQGRDLIVNLYPLYRKGIITDPEWNIKRPTEKNRPGILAFNDCINVTVTGITLKDAACWVQTYNKCTNVLIDGIKVESMAYWNNDGIDIVDCNKVKIANCNVNSADDGICLKSENAGNLCQNIEIIKCTVRSSASAVKLGTASVGGFKNIVVKDIYVFDTYRSAIALEAVDGGLLENVNVSGINAVNTGNAIFLRLGHRNSDERYSTLKHVHISNVKVQVPLGKPDIGYPVEGPLLKYPHNIFPSSITGIPGHPVIDVTLDNIEIIAGGNANKKTAYFSTDTLNKVPENIKGYPEYSMFGELPAWGLYVRHAEDVKISNFKLSYNLPDFRTACIFDDVKDLNLDNVTVAAAITTPVILLNNGQGININNIHLPFDNDKGIKRQ